MSEFRFSYTWNSTPLQMLATLIWNTCERFNIRVPFAPIIFGLVMGKRGKKLQKGVKK